MRARFHSPKALIFNTRAFSLIELMLSLSMLSIIALGTLSMLTSQQSGRQHLESRLLEIRLRSATKLALVSTQACTRTFSDKLPLSPNLIDRQVTAIKSFDGGNFDDVFVTGESYYNDALEVGQMEISALKLAPGESGIANVSIDLTKARLPASTPHRTTNVTFPIFVTLGSYGEVRSCSLNAPPVSRTATLQQCPDTADGKPQVLSGLGNGQSVCVPLATDRRCPGPNEVITGINADGTLNCVCRPGKPDPPGPVNILVTATPALFVPNYYTVVARWDTKPNHEYHIRLNQRRSSGRWNYPGSLGYFDFAYLRGNFHFYAAVVRSRVLGSDGCGGQVWSDWSVAEERFVASCLPDTVRDTNIRNLRLSSRDGGTTLMARWDTDPNMIYHIFIEANGYRRWRGIGGGAYVARNLTPGQRYEVKLRRRPSGVNTCLVWPPWSDVVSAAITLPD